MALKVRVVVAVLLAASTLVWVSGSPVGACSPLQSGTPPYTPGYDGAAATYDGIVPADDALAVDPSGNIYTAGGFSGTVDFNPSDAGVANLTGGYYDRLRRR